MFLVADWLKISTNSQTLSNVPEIINELGQCTATKIKTKTCEFGSEFSQRNKLTLFLKPTLFSFFNFNLIQFYSQLPQVTLYCKANPAIIQHTYIQNNQTTPCEEALGKSVKENLCFNRKNQWGATTCRDQLGEKGGRRDKSHSVQESQRLITMIKSKVVHEHWE